MIIAGIIRNVQFWLCILLAATAGAQSLAVDLSPPVTVTSGPAFGITRPRIALVQDSIPVVCWAKSTGAVFFSRWTGTAFSTPMQVSPVGVQVYSGLPEGPEIAASGDTVYIAFFATYTAAPTRVFLVRSFDGGTTWSDTVRVDQQDSLEAFSPVVAIGPGGNPYIAYEGADSNSDHPHQYFTRSADAGSSFLPEVLASSSNVGQPCECCPPAIALQDTSVMVVYRNNQGNIRDFYVGYSGNDGSSFAPAVPIDFSNWYINACPSSAADLLVSGDTLVGAWVSRIGTSNKIVTGTWNHASQQSGWNRLADPNPPVTNQARPSIAGNGDTLLVVWDDLRNNNVDCFMSVSVNGINGLNTLLQINDTAADAGTQNNVNIEYASGKFHLVYSDVTGNAVVYRTGHIQGFTGGPEFEAPSFSAGVFPNPASDDVLLQVSALPQEAVFSLFDGSGRRVKEEKILSAGMHKLSLSALDNGAYYYQISSGGQLVSGRLMIIR